MIGLPYAEEIESMEILKRAKGYSRIGILCRGFFSRDIAFLRKAYTV